MLVLLILAVCLPDVLVWCSFGFVYVTGLLFWVGVDWCVVVVCLVYFVVF